MASQCRFSPAHPAVDSFEDTKANFLEVVASIPKAYKTIQSDRLQLEDLASNGCPICRHLFEVVSELNTQLYNEATSVAEPHPPCEVILRKSINGQICLRVTVWSSSYYTLTRTPRRTYGQGPSASNIPFQDVQQPADFTKSLSLVRYWLSKCDNTHSCLMSWRPQLPTRVLTVRDGRIHLEEGAGRRALYVTLSHCWGKSRPVCLTRKTLHELLAQGMPISSLPATYRQAVHITCGLDHDIKHIWIDSLCIIQDDPTDWTSESRLMASVYGNAYLNLAASSAEDASAGFLGSRSAISTYSETSKVYYLPNSGLYAQRMNPHQFYCVSGWSGEQEYQAVAPPPLLGRAWVLQERLLASRVVYFDDLELLWECRAAADCECSSLALCPTTKGQWSEIDSYKNSTIWIVRWRDLIEEYSSMSLTYDADRLRALEGMATTVGARLGRHKYMQGVWTINMKSFLAWEVSNEFPRPSQQIAPSWSWAAVRGRIVFNEAVGTGARVECCSAWWRRLNGHSVEQNDSSYRSCQGRGGYQTTRERRSDRQRYLSVSQRADEVDEENSWFECECEEDEQVIVILGRTAVMQAEVSEPSSTTTAARFMLKTWGQTRLWKFRADVISGEHKAGFNMKVKIIWLATSFDDVSYFLVLSAALDGTGLRETVVSEYSGEEKVLWKRLGLLKINEAAAAADGVAAIVLSSMLSSDEGEEEALYVA